MGHSPCLNLTLVITFSFEVTAWSLCRISTRTHCPILPKWAYILDLRAHIQTLINTPVCLVKFLIFSCYLSFINVSVSSPKTNDVLLSCTRKKMLKFLYLLAGNLKPELDGILFGAGLFAGGGLIK